METRHHLYNCRLLLFTSRQIAILIQLQLFLQPYSMSQTMETSLTAANVSRIRAQLWRESSGCTYAGRHWVPLCVDSSLLQSNEQTALAPAPWHWDWLDFCMPLFCITYGPGGVVLYYYYVRSLIRFRAADPLQRKEFDDDDDDEQGPV